MNWLLGVVVSNLAVAAVLALVAWTAGRWLRRPALTHGLWLLVFLKLLTPPVLSVPVIRTQAPAPAPATAPQAAPTVAAQPVEPAPEPFVAVDLPVLAAEELPKADTKATGAQVATAVAPVPQQAPAIPRVVESPPAPPPPAPESTVPNHPWDWSWVPAALGGTWLAGAAFWFVLAAVRLARFHRLLRLGQAAPAELRIIARGVAERMQVRCPRLVLVPGAVSPMLWVFGNSPRLIVPTALVERLTLSQWRTLLAHELAHWRRRDHWVRWLELITLGLYWWCPLAWWAKQELQQAEEECCDAWVVSTLPEAARDYAFALVETVDFLSGARAALPPAASGLGHVHLLQRRLTMILSGRTPRALTLTGLLALVTLGMLLLPMALTWAQEAPPTAAAVPQKEDKEDKAEKTEKIDPDKARQDLQRIQDEFLKLQRQIDQKRRELEEKLQKEFGDQQKDLAKRLQEAAQKAGFPLAPGAGGLLPGNPGGLPGALPGIGLAQPGALQPGALPPPLAVAPGLAPGAFGQPRPDLERRLDDLERKLDKLLERLGGKGAAPGGRNPEGNAPPPPGGVRRPVPEAAPTPPPAKN